MGRGVCACLVVVLLAAGAWGDEWKLDVVHLKNKERFDGLIVEETKDTLRFKYVVRKPGARTLVFPTIFTRAEIDRIEPLTPEERKQLARRLAEIEGRAEREAALTTTLHLEPIAWRDQDQAWQYKGDHFVLASNARQDLVRRAVVRLDEIFAAYSLYLVPRRKPDKPTRILLYKTQKEYQDELTGMTGLNLLNPAYYDPQKNQIVAAGNLEQLAAELEQVRQKHEALLQEVRQQERKLREHFNGRPPAGMLQQLYQVRRRIEFLNNENECAFDRQNTRLFTTLYHEAFHAYLDNYVFPSADGPVPHWLNEGLAQIFETALVETGELRVGHVDAQRLVRVKDAVRQKQLLSLRELLTAAPREFYVAHRREEQAANRHFLAAWALAYYLTFDRKLLAGEPLPRYIAALQSGSDAVEAFQELIGQPLHLFEADFQRFILNLRTDGTSRG